MHPNARENMRQSLKEVLQNLEIQKGHPVLTSFCYDFLKKVLKYKKDWLSEWNVLDIFWDEVIFVLSKKISDDANISGNLIDLIGKEQIENLLDSIIGLINSIPRTYLVCFPLTWPDIKGEKVIELNSTISIKTLEIEAFSNTGPLFSNSTGLMPKIKTKKPYLCFKEKGYVNHSIEDSAFREALSKIKQLMYLGHIKKLFLKREMTVVESPRPLVGQWGQWYDKNVSAALVFEEEKTNLIEKQTIRLPADIAKHIMEIHLKISDSDFKDKGEHDVEDYIKKMLSDPLKVIANTQQDADVLPIKTALEWAFEASINDNETVSFIQTCIGFEAILGDQKGQNNEWPLTKKLADRCAYLISNTIKGRRKIREHFEKFYDLRSNLIHGRAVRLNDDERIYLDWGKRMLDKVIANEITHLNI